MHDTNIPIAIVGMGGIFPACPNLDAFWQLLLQRRTAARPIPRTRSGRSLAHFYQAETIALDKIISPYACLLDDTLLTNSKLADKFGRDPLITLTLAATQQALDDTRSWPDNIDHHTTNTIIGHVLLPTEHSSKLAEQFYFPAKYHNNPIDPINRGAADLPAIAIHQHFGLQGDRYCIDAACASTLYALKLAMDDLHNARASTVICGGVLRTDGLYPQMGFSQLLALSPRGCCLPLTAEADGLLVGEGAGIFVLKRLNDALVADDHIHGLISAVGLSNDTHGNILAPDSAGQLQAMHAAYQTSGLSPTDVDYIECHATGAPRGDAVEINSLQKLFTDHNTHQPPILGTVKGNIGHLLTAAGAAALAKILLALRHNTIPPNVGAHMPMPLLTNTPFVFNNITTLWPAHDNKPRRAAINGFGFGGINAHVIVEEYVAGKGESVAAAPIPPQEKKKWGLPPPYPRKGEVRGFAPETPQAFCKKLDQKLLVGDNLRNYTPTNFLKKVVVNNNLAKQIAVVGIAAHCGTLTDVKQVYESVFTQKKLHQKHIATIHAPLTRYRLPPTQIQEMLPQQLLMLNTACAAADMLDKIPATTGIYIGLGLDYYTNNFYLRWQQDNINWPALTYGRTLGALGSVVASRIARVLASHAPAFTISSDASSGIKAIELACTALQQHEITTAIVGAVDFAANPLNIYACGPSLHGYSDAACALVLKPLAAAQQDNNKILAIINNTSTPNYCTSNTSDTITPYLGNCGYAHDLLELVYAIMLAGQSKTNSKERDFTLRSQDSLPLSSSTRTIKVQPPPQPWHANQLNTPQPHQEAQLTLKTPTLTINNRTSYNYHQCLTFARGQAAAVLGKKFAVYDNYPARVRLPDEPLLLCHRILNCTTNQDERHPDTAHKLGNGKIQTAHDVRAQAWYLDHNIIPLSIAVEAGQADLFLCSCLGIDFINQGQAVYRLLDAQITCYQPLPTPPTTIIYNINIDRFFQHGDNWFFNFNFTASTNGKLLLRMENGCAGFFTAAQLAAGRGIPAAQRQPTTQKKSTATWPLSWQGNETYSSQQLAYLRQGKLATCFGQQFAALKLKQPCHLPHGHMQLIDRITTLQADGGNYGCGLAISELDIKPDAWFLTCHFVDDRVMPGTLMYECAMQTLRVYTMRRGWVSDKDTYRCDAVTDITTTLKCRGQVTDKNHTLRCEIHLQASGDTPSLYCLADAYLFVDDKCAVSCLNLSLQHTGITASQLKTIWPSKPTIPPANIVCSNEQILQFAEGDPARCFGTRYAAFSHQRRVARLPRPPYKFLDRITAATPQPASFTAAASCTAEYDLPSDLPYCNADKQLPFCVLLEIGLQPCGWLAAYIGCALQSRQDLSFRNLDGQGQLHQQLPPDTKTLTTHVRMNNLVQSMGMILCGFDLTINAATKKIYTAKTSFGFFTAQALAAQTGIRNAKLTEVLTSKNFSYPPDLVNQKIKMLDYIDCLELQGGQQQLGFVQGHKYVDADDWFFAAHFYQDPVVPGSLGLESLLQLFALLAREHWGTSSVMACQAHRWSYRGQVLPRQKKMTTQLEITNIDHTRRIIQGNGLLAVDGLVIYRMTDFAIIAD